MDLTPYKNCLALTNSIFIANEEKPYRPCCWFKTYIDAVDAEDYKKQLSEIDLEYNCDYCIKQDQGGEYSYRQQFDKPDELILTVSFDNICNLACVTCTPSNSTMLIKEFNADSPNDIMGKDTKYYTQLQKQAPKKIDFIKTTLANNKFKTIRFDILGGEPLINPAIFEFLDWLAEQPYAKDVMISFTTNGTTYNKKIENYLNKFSNVIIQLSIDGIGEEYEYLRYGNDFSTLEKVCDEFYNLTKYPNFLIGSHYTLSWINCLNFAKFFNWAQTRYPLWKIYVSKLDEPNQYSINILSLEMKTKIYNQVLSEINTPVNECYEQCLFLYKEHMLSTAYDKFDADKLEWAFKTLNAKDKYRKNDHKQLVVDFLKFIDYRPAIAGIRPRYRKIKIHND
jgi:sulfatase maturation enzyme AslB (radical SAM superfamily)